MATILLVVAALGLLSAAWQALGADVSGGVATAIVAAAAAALLTYVLSWTRFWPSAGAIATLIPTVASIAVVAADPKDPAWFAFIALSPALGTVLHPLKWAVVLAGVNLATVIGVVVVVPDLPPRTAITAVMFNVTMAAVLLIAATFRDRGERARRSAVVANQRLQESIIEGTFGGIAIVHDGVVREANHAFARLFDRVHADLEGTALTELFAADSLSDLQHEMAGRTVEIAGLRSDGTSFDVEAVVRRVDEEVEDVYVLALRDVSERKRANDALVHAQRMESVGRLAAGIAHDTNNELLVITVHAERLLRSGASDVQVDGIRHIQDAAGRVATLVQRVLVFGRDQVDEIVIDLPSFVGRCCAAWHQVLGPDVEVVVAAHPGAGAVLVDENRLVQLLLNVVLNARDAIDGAGEIRVAIDGRNVTEVGEVGTVGEVDAVGAVGTVISDTGVRLPPGRYQAVTVTDHGGGIAADHLDSVFDAFFTTKDTGRGTGLGLYTSRRSPAAPVAPSPSRAAVTARPSRCCCPSTGP